MLIKKLGFVPVKPNKKLVVLFNRQRRIDLLWNLLLSSLFALFLFALALVAWP